MKRHMPTISMLVLGLCMLAVSASAQTTDQYNYDDFKVGYFANNGVAGAPDATVRIDNPGSAAVCVDGINPAGISDLCAMIYVFDNDQQLTECCGCLVTPDGLRTLSVRHDLIGNPLTGTVSNNGVIKIVSAAINNLPCALSGVSPDISSSNPTCDPTGDVYPAPTLRAWVSHVQNKVGSAYPITETAFTDATLSDQELDFNLEEQCAFAQRLGSGKGVCSCGTGD
jgi:hypothetical protein